jgi:hypothetical protein
VGKVCTGGRPFCAAVGVKGAAEVAVGDELMSGGSGGGKMNCVWLDRVQGGRASGWRNVAVGAVGVRRQLRRGRGGGGGRSGGVAWREQGSLKGSGLVGRASSRMRVGYFGPT